MERVEKADWESLCLDYQNGVSCWCRLQSVQSVTDSVLQTSADAKSKA